MASVSSGGSLPDDNFSNDSLDYVFQDVQTENDADDFRSLMDEIGIVVQYILYFWCISFFNFFNLFWRKVTMMNLTKIWKVKFGSTSPLMGQVEAKPRVSSAKNLSTARVGLRQIWFVIFEMYTRRNLAVHLAKVFQIIIVTFHLF